MTYRGVGLRAVSINFGFSNVSTFWTFGTIKIEKKQHIVNSLSEQLFSKKIFVLTPRCYSLTLLCVIQLRTVCWSAPSFPAIFFLLFAYVTVWKHLFWKYLSENEVLCKTILAS